MTEPVTKEMAEGATDHIRALCNRQKGTVDTLYFVDIERYIAALEADSAALREAGERREAECAFYENNGTLTERTILRDGLKAVLTIGTNGRDPHLGAIFTAYSIAKDTLVEADEAAMKGGA